MERAIEVYGVCAFLRAILSRVRVRMTNINLGRAVHRAVLQL